MHCRAYLLLEREYEELQEAQLYGISVTCAEDKPLKWIARIRGLKDSLWEGAVLQLSMSYTEEYNGVPPSVMFTTIPFHPNVDQTSGRPCVDFLDNASAWNPRYTMTDILLAIQVLLSNPKPEDAVNPEAAHLLLNQPDVYRQRLLSCVKSSRLIDSGLIQDYSPVQKTPPASETPPGPRCRIIIPGLTQNPTGMMAMEAHGGVYNSSCVFCRMSENCGVELKRQPRPQNNQRTNTAALPPPGSGQHTEPHEEEVDHLVAWTNTLHPDLLED
ncbi:ubiquitin-conjugating enzyme E2 U [Gastrophryne carolinensis]